MFLELTQLHEEVHIILIRSEYELPLIVVAHAHESKWTVYAP